MQDAIAGVGTCVLVTRSLCTLSLILCLNERGVHVGFFGKVGLGLVSRRHYIGKEGCNQTATVEIDMG